MKVLEHFSEKFSEGQVCAVASPNCWLGSVSVASEINPFGDSVLRITGNCCAMLEDRTILGAERCRYGR